MTTKITGSRTKVQNVGSGNGVLRDQVGNLASLKSLIGGPGIGITNNANDLTINLAAQSIYIAVNGSNSPTANVDWDDNRILNVGVADISGSEPTGVTGKLWLDTAAEETPLFGVISVVTKTSDFTATQSNDVILVDASSGAVTITLMGASDREGKTLFVKKVDSTANAVTVDGDGSETIDDSTTRVLSSQYDSVQIVSDGSEWWII